MKKIIALLLVMLMSLSLSACSKKITAEDVKSLYEEIELTTENVMDYFELVETEHKDAFGDSTGEIAFVLKIKDGYIFEPDKDTVLRVNFTYTTMQYAEGSEKPEFPTENIENNENVVRHRNEEQDFHYTDYDRQRDLLITDHVYYAEIGDVKEGYLCETQVSNWEIVKVAGKIIAYNLNELDKLFPVDKDGYRNVEIWLGKKHRWDEKFDSNSEDWEHAYWYEIIYNMLADME